MRDLVTTFRKKELTISRPLEEGTGQSAARGEAEAGDRSLSGAGARTWRSDFLTWSQNRSTVASPLRWADLSSPSLGVGVSLATFPISTNKKFA